MLDIHLLGELQVERDGDAVPLPASRKSRALLGYLAATATPHLRERLCELLWEGPDDPRGALRWSLAKLRPITGPALVAGRDRVAIAREGVRVDADRLGTPATATTEALEQCASLFRGEFLEGLDLPSCYRWQQWCAGERERFRLRNLEILAELTARLGSTPAALAHARRRVVLDPFNDAAHASLIRLLSSLGNPGDALRQYEECRELFARELGAAPGEDVETARREITARKRARPAAAAPPVAMRREARAPFVGRDEELRILLPVELTRPAHSSNAKTRASETPAPHGGGAPVPDRKVALVLGEPGIGKSRLIEEARARCEGVTLYGRAFAAEMIRPYGVWADAMRDFPAAGDRAQLFDAVIARLDGVAMLAIDDLQWIDEASTALVHYAARKAATRIVLSARAGELEDNAHAARLVRELARDGRLVEISLGPLAPEEVRRLVGDESAARLSGGNPLFALELAQSGTTGALSNLIGARIDQLDASARELAQWAAAIGRGFDAEIVGRATGMPSGEMLAALARLERAAILRATSERTYDFSHDLIRDAAYHRISGPRRALVHRHIARALGETHDPDGARAGDVLHHASIAGDAELAVRAAIAAGQRCLRMFAYAEGTSVARRGIQLAAGLPDEQRIASEMKLMEVLVMARTPIRERIELTGRIGELVEDARRLALPKPAALGSHLLACLHEESNAYSEAAADTVRAAELARSADAATMAHTMANTARCLLVLQRDVGRAEQLLRDVCASGFTSTEVLLGLGFLEAHQGRYAEAMRHLEEGLESAAREQDRWRETIAVFHIVTVALELGDAPLALRWCARMREVASKMSGGSEEARGEALEILARHCAGEAVDVERAIARLREIDSKSDLAWALTLLAARERDPERARLRAADALAAADAVGRRNEAAIARRILRLPVKASPELSARARAFLRKEKPHAETRDRTEI